VVEFVVDSTILSSDVNVDSMLALTAFDAAVVDVSLFLLVLDDESWDSTVCLFDSIEKPDSMNSVP
jgi:hypothetical protein